MSCKHPGSPAGKPAGLRPASGPAEILILIREGCTIATATATVVVIVVVVVVVVVVVIIFMNNNYIINDYK